jgi:NADPH-dependent 2,4-dienoyl-CoA reductase/sulfur reductase-like enzyme
VDDNFSPGGQVWRQEAEADAFFSPPVFEWLSKLVAAKAEWLPGTQVVGSEGPGPSPLLVEGGGEVGRLRWRRLVLATGARERFLPFPGWTLPGVLGAGGLQALVKAGLPIEGRRVVVAGSGPLLLAVAAYLKKRGARVAAVAEQAPLSRLAPFAAALARLAPGKLVEGARLRWALRGVPYRTGCWVARAEGRGQLQGVTLTDGRRAWAEPCDFLACGFGLVPNTELPALLGCAVGDGGVVVDEYQRTTVADIFCAGEPTGIGGLEKSLVEGRIAGLAAAGREDRARWLFGQRRRWRRFARALEEAFALRPELRRLARDDTLVCRCEDVALGRLRNCGGWREAKLQTRCGMGPCQGRVCGPAVEFLFGWRAESVRPPVLPASVGALAGG